MSVVAKKGRGSTEEKRRGERRVWPLFPHAFLILSLIGYAVLGAWVFRAIEGRNSANSTGEDYRNFVRQVVETVNNHSDHPEKQLLDVVGQKILRDFKAVWSQTPERWSFYGSLFFCCTVFTTVGYGDMYPVTLLGRLACILYAMVGIPLMLLVISDFGDILAKLVFNVYRRAHNCWRRSCSRTWSPAAGVEKPQGGAGGALHDRTYNGSYHASIRVSVGHEAPPDVGRVVRSQSSVKHKPVQVFNNIEIFDRIVAREKFERRDRLVRSCSCPELNQMPPPPTSYGMWDFASIGQEMENFNVPFLIILLVVFAYILGWALILPLWEKEFSRFDAFYFCFITLTTIGFGDIVPQHPKFFMLTFLFIISGMAIMSMAFKLGQTRIVSCYRRCISCVSCLSMSRGGRV
ncbi:potassium channel subfamily K member 18 [Brachyhypopomus gauderio]|uniref:potassium channel subfamily K member 18 n=1 Tax=Brachyhypopomus gauderio TaxID=698409 RepID=UPI0040431859